MSAFVKLAHSKPTYPRATPPSWASSFSTTTGPSRFTIRVMPLHHTKGLTFAGHDGEPLPLAAAAASGAKPDGVQGGSGVGHGCRTSSRLTGREGHGGVAV